MKRPKIYQLHRKNSPIKLSKWLIIKQTNSNCNKIRFVNSIDHRRLIPPKRRTNPTSSPSIPLPLRLPFEWGVKLYSLTPVTPIPSICPSLPPTLPLLLSSFHYISHISAALQAPQWGPGRNPAEINLVHFKHVTLQISHI